MNRIAIATALGAAIGLAACSGNDSNMCLPKGEKGVVLRSGTDEGFRYVTIKRANGEEVTCTGKSMPALLQEGDEVDGWTMTRVDATKKRS